MRPFVLAGVSGVAGLAIGVTIAPWVRPGHSRPLSAAPSPEELERSRPESTMSNTARSRDHNGVAAQVAAAAASLEAARRVEIARAASYSTRIPHEQAPLAVRDALQRFWKGRPVEDIRMVRKQREHGPSFQTKFVLSGLEHEMDYDGSGRLLKGEIDLAPGDLSAEVMQGLQAHFTEPVVSEVEKVIDEDGQPLGFEIDLRAGGRVHEVYVSADGQTVRHRK